MLFSLRVRRVPLLLLHQPLLKLQAIIHSIQTLAIPIVVITVDREVQGSTKPRALINNETLIVPVSMASSVVKALSNKEMAEVVTTKTMVDSRITISSVREETITTIQTTIIITIIGMVVAAVATKVAVVEVEAIKIEETTTIETTISSAILKL